jgi:hypothetical protein
MVFPGKGPDCKVVNSSLTAGFGNQPPVFLTSVNAEQLKQVNYKKDSTIDFTEHEHR